MSNTAEKFVPDLERIAADAGRDLERVREFFHLNKGKEGSGSVDPFHNVTDHEHAVAVVQNSLAPDPEPAPPASGSSQS